MQMLYNSDSYAVVQIDVPGAGDAENTAPARGGYEIVDKFARRGLFLDGLLADSFKQGVQALIDSEPTEEALDAYIGRFASLMQQPLTLH